MSDKSKARSVKIKLPQVDLVLRQTPLVELSEEIDRRYLSRLVRDELQGIRSRLIDDAGASSDPDLLNCDEVQVALSVARNARSIFNAGLRRVINGTGVVLNTNLGRAPLGLRSWSQGHGSWQGQRHGTRGRGKDKGQGTRGQPGP